MLALFVYSGKGNSIFAGKEQLEKETISSVITSENNINTESF